jgi:hypothetical protein
VQVNSDIELLPPQPTREREVIAETGSTPRLRNDNDVSQITIPADNRRSGRFDDIRELAGRVAAAQCGNERCRQHDVTYQPQSD